MPSAGPRSRIFGPATTQNKPCGFKRSRGVKGCENYDASAKNEPEEHPGEGHAKRTCAAEYTNSVCGLKGWGTQAIKTPGEAIRVYKRLEGIRASKGALAWARVKRSRVQRVLTAPNIGVQSVTNGHRKGVLDMEYLRGTEVPQSADNWATR